MGQPGGAFLRIGGPWVLVDAVCVGVETTGAVLPLLALPRMASAAANPAMRITAQTTIRSRSFKGPWLYCLSL
jgi:hypothetical protein